MRILTVCGSLRAGSSNRAMLRAYERLSPLAISFEHYERVGSLPHFNPDLDRDGEALPQEVTQLRNLVREADVMMISTPEYAHGLPGSFKNALDWLVSDPTFPGKHVVILHASRGSTWALDSLREVLKTMSARFIEAASVSLPLGSNRLDDEAILVREDLRSALLRSVAALLAATKTEPNPPPEPARSRRLQ
jgi:NAD(P)H-dependent FMN reductase